MNEIIVAIEGIDGVGKATQSKLLTKRLISHNYPVKFLSFPTYNSFFGKMIGNYLDGKYGTLTTVPIEFSSLLFALDRWKVFNDLKSEDRAGSTIFIIDRYVPSNIAHQAAKLYSKRRQNLIKWITYLEYEIFRIPRPTIVLVLDADPIITSKQLLMKGRRSYTKKKMDLHEQNKGYLKNVRDVYKKLCKTENNFKLIKCTEGATMRKITDIAEDIWLSITPVLASKIER